MLSLGFLPYPWITNNIFIFFFFIFLAEPLGLQDLSSPTRDRTQAPTVKAQGLNHWAAREFPTNNIFVSIFLEINSLIFTYIHFISKGNALSMCKQKTCIKTKSRVKIKAVKQHVITF